MYNDRYIKTKIRKYDDNVYTSFRGLNVPEDGVECESFTTISIGSLLAYEKASWFFTCLSASIFRQLWLQNCKHRNGRLS